MSLLENRLFSFTPYYRPTPPLSSLFVSIFKVPSPYLSPFNNLPPPGSLLFPLSVSP